MNVMQKTLFVRWMGEEPLPLFMSRDIFQTHTVGS